MRNSLFFVERAMDSVRYWQTRLPAFPADLLTKVTVSETGVCLLCRNEPLDVYGKSFLVGR